MTPLRLLIHYRAVHVEPRLQTAGPERMTLLGILGQLDANARSVGDKEEALLKLRRAADDLALRRFVLSARVLLQGENCQ